MPALFSDFKKYNKIVEYEITEFSIKRGITIGVTIENVLNYLNSFNIKVSKNVETVIKQWFDKHGSFFYSSGTFFFCQNIEKGKIINSLIEKGMIKAYEIKKNEIFLISEENKKQYFEFLEKAGINFYHKIPSDVPPRNKEKILNLSCLLNNVEDNRL